MSTRITLEAMKKALPPGTKGLAFYEDVKSNKKPDTKRMTYGEFLKLPSKQKGKIKTITYWRMGHDDGPEFKGGFYVETWMMFKINGRHLFYFMTVAKVLDSGKTMYVSPTTKNSDYKQYL